MPRRGTGKALEKLLRAAGDKKHAWGAFSLFYYFYLKKRELYSTNILRFSIPRRSLPPRVRGGKITNLFAAVCVSLRGAAPIHLWQIGVSVQGPGISTQGGTGGGLLKEHLPDTAQRKANQIVNTSPIE